MSSKDYPYHSWILHKLFKNRADRFMSKSQANTHSKKTRQRRLNVVYFVDAAKTRSFSVSMKTLNFFLGMLTLLVLGAVGSFILATYFASEKIELQHRLESAYTTIFDYQVQYDGIFDNIYTPPKKPSKPVAVINESLKVRAATPTTDVKAKQSPKTSPVKPINKGTHAKEKTIVKEETKVIDKPVEWKVTLKNPSYRIRNRLLTFTVAIQNSNKTVKAEGYIWAVAKLKNSSNNEIKYIAAPSYISIDKKGNLKKTKKRRNFRIKNFKKEVFEFLLPTEFTGTIIEIKTYAANDKGDMSSAGVDINKPYGAIPQKIAKPAHSVAPQKELIKKDTNNDQDTKL